MSIVENERIDTALRLRTAINMLREKDRRALPFLRELAESGKPKHRARAMAAILRHGGAPTAIDQGEGGLSRDRINEILRMLEAGGKAARDNAREWNALVPSMGTPTVRAYLKSKESDDGIDE